MIKLNESSSVEIGGAAVENRVVIEVKNDTAASANTASRSRLAAVPDRRTC